MDNARIGYVNKADTGEVSASSQVLLAPVTRLQDPHVSVKWQGNSGSETVTLDMGSVQTIDCARLMGLTGDTIRWKYSTTDAGAGDVYDTGVLPIDQDFLTATDIRTVSARYVRAILTSPTVCEAGRLFVGELDTFGYSFSPNWTRRWVDP